MALNAWTEGNGRRRSGYLLDMREIGCYGAEFLDRWLHARGRDIAVAADEGIAPGGESAEGAVEAVICDTKFSIAQGHWSKRDLLNI